MAKADHFRYGLDDRWKLNAMLRLDYLVADTANSAVTQRRVQPALALSLARRS